MVGKELAPKTADRDAATGLKLVTIDRVVERFENEPVFNEPRQRFFENVAVDRIEIFADVLFEKEAKQGGLGAALACLRSALRN